MIKLEIAKTIKDENGNGGEIFSVLIKNGNEPELCLFNIKSITRSGAKGSIGVYTITTKPYLDKYIVAPDVVKKYSVKCEDLPF